MYVGITTHSMYGISGNELPPPVKSRTRVACLLDVETFEEANQIMMDKVLPMRHAAERADIRPYSQADGYEWEAIIVSDEE